MRLIRPKGYVISLDLVDIPNTQISIPKDICDYCIIKIAKKLRPKDADIVDLIKDGIPEGKSLEDLV